MSHLDQVTDEATAFRSFRGLVDACQTGYVPSLRRDDTAQSRVGGELERRGFRVFWGV